MKYPRPTNNIYQTYASQQFSVLIQFSEKNTKGIIEDFTDKLFQSCYSKLRQDNDLGFEMDDMEHMIDGNKTFAEYPFVDDQNRCLFKMISCGKAEVEVDEVER